MYAIPQIPGVTLEVYKEKRRLEPQKDGYLGQLWSGSTVVLAVIDPAADYTIGLFRDGADNYIQQKDWLNNPKTEVQQRCHDLYLADRSFSAGTKVHGVKVPLRVIEADAINSVHYPENMFMLAQYASPNVVLWKIALVSQKGEFFLTVQEAYNVPPFRDDQGELCFPRFAGHKRLERLLIDNTPDGFPALHLEEFQRTPALQAGDLAKDEGVVERWYDARNMGCIITSRGTARVHWQDVPGRPRRQFLSAGERVRFSHLGKPPMNPRTAWRNVRQSRFQLQVYGVELS